VVMMVPCGSWLWQWCSGVRVALVPVAVGVVVVVRNVRGWWLCSGGGCQCDGKCGCRQWQRVEGAAPCKPKEREELS